MTKKNKKIYKICETFYTRDGYNKLHKHVVTAFTNNKISYETSYGKTITISSELAIKETTSVKEEYEIQEVRMSIYKTPDLLRECIIKNIGSKLGDLIKLNMILKESLEDINKKINKGKK